MRAGTRVTPMQPGRARQRSRGRAEMILFLLALLNDEVTDERVHAGVCRVKISLLIFEVMRASIIISLNRSYPGKSA